MVLEVVAGAVMGNAPSNVPPIINCLGRETGVVSIRFVRGTSEGASAAFRRLAR